MALFEAMFMLPTGPAQDCIEVNRCSAEIDANDPRYRADGEGKNHEDPSPHLREGLTVTVGDPRDKGRQPQRIPAGGE
jgi:hypothetical protein